MRVRDLTFRYAERRDPALREISFDVVPGESVLVLGPSGSGKSTLTLCLDGLIPHVVEGEYEGIVEVGRLIAHESDVPRLARDVGLVFQDPESQFATLTVADEVAFGLESLAVSPEVIAEASGEALAAVGLAGFDGRRLTTLSGGEKQRVALASVLAMGPRVIVLDEPSANLDPAGAVELFRHLRRMARDGGHTLIVIEHRLDELVEWIDSVLVLDACGRVLFRGDPREAFYERSAELVAAGVWRPQTTELVLALKERGWPVPGRPLTIAETATALADTPGLFRSLGTVGAMGESAGAPDSAPAPVPAAGQGVATGPDGAAEPALAATLEQAAESDGAVSSAMPAIEVRDLTYCYDPAGPAVLEGVSLAIPEARVTAIVGANGAGKSTLAGLISGVLAAAPGSVFIGGRDTCSLEDRVRSTTVGHVFQNPEHQFVTNTVRGELVFSLTQRSTLGSLEAAHAALVDSWLDRFGLSGLAEAGPFTLSQGQKRRLSVAAMLIRGQSVLVLDEPTFGQDRRQADRLISTLVEQSTLERRTILMVTHDMRLVAEYANNVVVLVEGGVAFQGPPSLLFRDEALLRRAGLTVPAVGMLGSLLRDLYGAENDFVASADLLLAVGLPGGGSDDATDPASETQDSEDRRSAPGSGAAGRGGDGLRPALESSVTSQAVGAPQTVGAPGAPAAQGGDGGVGAQGGDGAPAAQGGDGGVGGPAAAASGLGRYLSRRNPALKLVVLLLVSLMLTAVFDPYTPAAFLALGLVAGRVLGGLTPWSVARAVAPLLIAGVGVFVANILFNRLNEVSPALLVVGPVRVTEVALSTAASLTFRLLAFAVFSVVFVRTTDAGDLLLSLVHQVRLDERLVFGTMVGYRMLPLLTYEYGLIKAAHRVRGVREGGGPVAAARRTWRYAIPLLAGAVRRAGRVAIAMDARAFGAGPRTYRRRSRVVAADWVFLVLGVAVPAGLILVLRLAGVTRFGIGV